MSDFSDILNPDGSLNHELLILEGNRVRREMNERDFEQAAALWAAGWKAETPHRTQEDIMSWYWRRPPKRKGQKGRLFWSTNQAHNAMLKERLDASPPADIIR